MNEPIQIKIECAKGELLNAINKINVEMGLPPCIIEGILGTVLSEIRSQQSIDLINAYVEIKKSVEKEEDRT